MDSTTPEGIFDTNAHFQQTEWNDDTCAVAQGTQEAGKGFFVMNHWKNNEQDLPSESNAEEFNKYDVLMARIQRCENRIPNLIAVDFWDVGDVLPFVKDVSMRNVGEGTTVAAANQP